MGQDTRSPAPGIRASDAERAEVIAQLGQGIGEGRLDVGTYSERAAAAYAATTRNELEPLTRDLPEPAQRHTVTAPPDTERLSAVLGNECRKGAWNVPAHLIARSVLGDCHIELQRARLSQPVTTIEATAILGSVTIFVPEGVDVRLSGSAVLGAKSQTLATRPAEGAPVIHVSCRVRLGSVSVRPLNR